MPTNDLSPAAEAFLSDLAHWLPKDVLEEARGRLVGLLEGVRSEERERLKGGLQEAHARFALIWGSPLANEEVRHVAGTGAVEVRRALGFDDSLLAEEGNEDAG